MGGMSRQSDAGGACTSTNSLGRTAHTTHLCRIRRWRKQVAVIPKLLLLLLQLKQL